MNHVGGQGNQHLDWLGFSPQLDHTCPGPGRKHCQLLV
jgi:hypothetical protein